MSIFTKDCPQCATPNPVSAVRCACGHCFDVTDKKAAVEVALHEERLYHDYLAARVVQAEAEYEVARTDALADPGDTYKAAHALAAEQALHTARAELRAQAQKAARLNTLMPRTAPPAPATPPPPKAHAKPRGTKRKHVAAPRDNKARAVAMPVVAAPIVAPPVAATPKPTTRVAAAAVPPPPKPAPKINVVAAPLAVAAAKPSRAFRARQAKQADAIVRKAQIAPVVPSADIPAAHTAAPPAPSPATKECPNCTAKVAPQLAQCRCGFGFGTASLEMASLALDAAALAILRK